jgi:hypothetical protein
MTEPKRWTVLLHGEPKVADLSGLAETCIGPRLFIDSGTNGRWLQTNTVEWNPNNPPPTGLDPNDTVVVLGDSWNKVKAAIEWLGKGGHEFKSVILDSLTDMQNAAKWDITTDGMKIQDWGTLLDEMGPVIQEVINLVNHPTAPLWNVVLTALSVDVKDRMVPSIRGGVAGIVASQVDTVGFVHQSEGVMNPDGSVPDMVSIVSTPDFFAGDQTRILKAAFPKGADLSNENLTTLLRKLQEVPNA